MGEIEGTYRVLQTPGSRLGVQKNSGVSTLEPGQNLSTAMASSPARTHERDLQIKIKMLDNTVEVLDIESKYYGQALLTEVYKHLNLIESDYFGIEFQNIQSYWVRIIWEQIHYNKKVTTMLRLAVKFFPPDPGQLQEEYTRYLFALQIKRDLAEERLTCSDNTAALLVSHLLQSEIGDFDESEDREHLKVNRYLPNQERIQGKILEFHRKHGEGWLLSWILTRCSLFCRRHSKVRVSTHASNTDVPKQSAAFPEGLRTPGSPASATVPFHSVHCSAAPTVLPIFAESSPSSLDPRASLTSLTSWSTVQIQTPGTLKPLHLDHSQLSSLVLKSPLGLNPAFPVNLNAAGQGSSPLLSPVLSDAGGARIEEEDEMKRKRYPTDKAYFIAKEILATERTYLKDLEVITVWFRSAVIKENAMPEGLMTLLFSNIDPIYEFHRGFLKEIEQRLSLWEGRTNAHVKGDYQRIGDVMLRNMRTLKEFTSYLQKHDEVLTELEKATKRLKKLEMVYKEFELQKVCYLPLNTFLLKPIQRLMHYKLILGRLCKHYTAEHRDFADCRNALKEVTEMTSQLQHSLIRLENFQKLTELQHDLIGIDNLTAPGREFIREGCLYKLTKKGLQQRMFFLFSDMLLYTSKGVTGTNQFKIHGHLPLHGMLVEESENEWAVPHCFTIYSAQKTIVVAASTRLEMGKWMEDLNMAIEMAKKSTEKSDIFLKPLPNSPPPGSSDEVSLEQESEDDIHSSRSSLDRQSHHRANTTMHVCWYRNTSVSMADHSVAVENQLSGYLLRKFKNSNGWQKLWVVFTNFCLFFYKTHQDDYPLASLPLLGYVVSSPVEADGIQKDYVFKLQFKSHVYFFRAESKYTFERWMEVIKRATSSPARSSLLLPKDEKDRHTD
uniref:FERM, ARH/RhoGEF and pleckstrin domain protein 2 n=1 Tax=Chrysolophus pictus TaxID=9089 RepID=A0A8C3LPX8_CHRPC